MECGEKETKPQIMKTVFWCGEQETLKIRQVKTTKILDYF